MKNLTSLYILILSLIIGLLHFPFVIAKSAVGDKSSINLPANYSIHNESSISPVDPDPPAKNVYDSLHLDRKGLSKEAFEYACEGLDKLVAQGALNKETVISIIDFSQPSSKKRLFIIDLENYKILFNSLVAHGRNTGREFATNFSNRNQSYQSSPGFYITKETYQGKNGYSLKLDGIEKGINDNAYDRGIVMHGASYVAQNYVNAQGYIGRSQGCPAIPQHLTYPVINTIKEGSLVFIYHPSYINRSKLLG